MVYAYIVTLFSLSKKGKFFSYLFIYLAALSFSCGRWDLLHLPGIKLSLPALGAWSLSHWESPWDTPGKSQKQENLDACNMDQLQGQYTKLNKTVTKRQVCMIPPIWGTDNSQIHWDRKQNESCQGLGEEGIRVIWCVKSFSFIVQGEKSSGDWFTEMCMY